jgi:DNA-binding CsgD family transcriptional regulator/tetratricopeptide (TPR) repeat protein
VGAGGTSDGGERAAPFTGLELPAARTAPGAVVGRAADCGALENLVQAVSRGLSRTLVIVGEPGIGKTRLLQYAASAADGLRTLSIAGVESELRLGFAAVHRMLVPFSERIGTLPAPQRDALGSAFGLASGPPADRFLVGLGALTLFAEVAAEQPLIWLVDDAQWLDRESLEVLGFVGRRLYADGIGLLFAAREPSPGLTALDGLPTRHLRGLEPAAARALLARTLPGPLNARVAARIITETGGNPLALLELAGLLTPDQLAGRSPLPQRLPVGRRMQGHFLQQVKMLPAATGSLLLLASAASSDDPAALWRAAARLGLEPDAAEPAVAQDIISLEPRVAFRHPLIRSAIYEGARPGDRRKIHDALADTAAADGYLDQAAWHRAAAAVVPAPHVAADLERSAVRAERRGGYVAQAAFLARAAELTPDPRDRAIRLFGAAQAHLAAGDGALAEALLDQAAPRLAEAGMHVAAQRLRAAIAVFFSRHKDSPALLLGAIGAVDPPDVPIIREMLFEAMQAVLVARQYTTGTTPVDVAHAALQAPRRPDQPPTVTDLLLDGFATRTAVGYASAVPLLRSAVMALSTAEQTAQVGIPATILGWFAADDLWDDRGRRAALERAEAVQRRHGALGALRITLAGLTTGEGWAGRPREAEARYLEAAEISSLIGVPAPATTGVLLELRAWQGREQESRALAEMTAQWGQERGAAILEVFALMGLTILELGLGRYSEALSGGMRIYDDDPPGFGNRVLPEIVEAAVRCGEHHVARAALGRLADRATASGTPWALGMLARSRALLAHQSGAETFYREALAHLSETSVRTELARAHLLYGEWLRRQRRRKDAQSQLRTACDMFDAMGAAGFASRTRGELLAAGDRRPHQPAERPGPDLTPQEAQVVRLAASGATNAEIATHLFVTTSTVEYHLSKVFRKLGITSRRQLATALRH